MIINCSDNFFVKNKLSKQLLKNGGRDTSEKIIIQSFKKLQTESSKKTKDIIVLTIINTLTFFKVHKFSQKKKKK